MAELSEERVRVIVSEVLSDLVDVLCMKAVLPESIQSESMADALAAAVAEIAKEPAQELVERHEKYCHSKTSVQGVESAKMSNLITDMTIARASEEELQRAIKHSMAAMDFEKSAVENGIAELLEKYHRV